MAGSVISRPCESRMLVCGTGMPLNGNGPLGNAGGGAELRGDIAKFDPNATTIARKIRNRKPAISTPPPHSVTARVLDDELFARCGRE